MSAGVEGNAMGSWHDVAWLVWLAAALAAALIEVASLHFVAVMFVVGALAATLAALLGLSFTAQVVVFAVSSAVLLIVARPPVLRWAMRGAPLISTNVSALVGLEARVLVPVTERDGQVKLAGEVWTARTTAGGIMLEVGSVVHVLRIDGATAVVAPTRQLGTGDLTHRREPE